MSKETEFAMTKWNSTAPQIHVPDITTMPVFEYHMSTQTAVISIIMIVILFVLSVISWFYCVRSRVQLHQIVYALGGLLFSFGAGRVLFVTIINW